MECGCGRSPTGKCIGWHNLSEEEQILFSGDWVDFLITNQIIKKSRSPL